MAKDDKDKTAEEAPKKSKKKLLIIIIAVVVLLGGGGGAYVMLGSSSSSAAPAPVAGLVAPLDPTTINLADGHYLKLQMSLQATDKISQAPDGSKAMDVAINLYSNMSSTTLLTAKGREAAKAQLKDQIVKAYTVDKVVDVMDVYFTAFVIQ
jgi:flagellar FliL protein